MTETPLQRARRKRREAEEAENRYIEELKVTDPSRYKYIMDLRETAKKEEEYRRNNPNWYQDMKDHANERLARSVTTTYERSKKIREQRTNAWLGLDKE